MGKYGIPQQIIDLIKSSYEGYTCQVVHEGRVSEPIPVTTGVRQGSVLSPALFLMVLDEVVRKVTSTEKRGITWTMTEQLEDLDFADDICLLSHTFNKMEAKLEELEVQSKQVGLKINSNKTKAITINAKAKQELKVGGQIIEQVSIDSRIWEVW